MSIASIARRKFRNACIVAFGAAAIAAAPSYAQTIETIDPSDVIDGDLVEAPGDGPVYADEQSAQVEQSFEDAMSVAQDQAGAAASNAADASSSAGADVAPTWANPDSGDSAYAVNNNTGVSADTYQEDDLIGAAEGVFGKGAKGVAKMIQDLLKKQGEPNGYIVGREAGGAFIVGARYGSGTLFHKVEGEQKVYWTGPSIGFDAGANAGNTFVLIYNLYDTQDIFKRFPAGEGQAYLVGGLHASYLRRGDIVMIPIRVGAGLRLGVNAGYMRFSKKQRWLPF
ncbi:DUF1134 domain-containing protein [Pontixanthobacter rizhaonensis]|nr:DUF1134 domain-containing protein [Pontixanthobacter rizhaonensis]